MAASRRAMLDQVQYQLQFWTAGGGKVPKYCIELAVRILYLSRTKLVYLILFLSQVGRHHVSCARLYLSGYDLSTYFRLMAAIFDFSLICTSDSLRSSLIVSSDLENMGIAVGISLLLCIDTELRLISFFQPPSWISDFRFHPKVFLMVPLKSLSPKT